MTFRNSLSLDTPTVEGVFPSAVGLIPNTIYKAKNKELKWDVTSWSEQHEGVKASKTLSTLKLKSKKGEVPLLHDDLDIEE